MVCTCAEMRTVWNCDYLRKIPNIVFKNKTFKYWAHCKCLFWQRSSVLLINFTAKFSSFGSTGSTLFTLIICLILIVCLSIVERIIRNTTEATTLFYSFFLIVSSNPSKTFPFSKGKCAKNHYLLFTVIVYHLSFVFDRKNREACGKRYQMMSMPITKTFAMH